MENSDVVSMSESSTFDQSQRGDGKKGKKDDPANELAITKKKLKVLKQAYKQETMDKQSVEKKLQESQNEVTALKQQMAEKDKKYLNLLQEKTNLEDSLLQTSVSSSKPQNKSVAELGQQMKQKAVKTLAGAQVLGNDDVKRTNSKQNDAAQVQSIVEIEMLKETHKVLVDSKNNEISQLQKQLQEIEAQISFYDNKAKEANEKQLSDQIYFEKQIDEFRLQIEVQKQELMDRDAQITVEKEKTVKELEKQQQEFEVQKDDLKKQIEEVHQDKNRLQDEKFSLEEKIDQKQDQITQLEKSLQKALDEVELRKTIVDQMGENLMKHETESAQMSQNLTLMKNQIMEYDRSVGMDRKYGAVRIQTIKNTPVTLSFVEEKDMSTKEMNWFLIIDSKQFEISVNCENIEEFYENKEQKIIVVFYLPEGKTEQEMVYVRKQEVFDCCENNLLLKTFKGIKEQVIQQCGGKKNFQKKIEELKSGSVQKQNMKSKLKDKIKMNKLF